MVTLVTLILNYNGKQDTSNCLKSIQKLTLPKNLTHHVIVVDNNSADGSLPYLQKKYPNVYFVTSTQNLGFTGGNNLGVDYARRFNPDWIMLLNNDTILDPELISNFLLFTKNHPQSVILSPKIYFAPGHEFHANRYSKKDLGNVIWYAGGQIDWQNLIVSHRGVDEVDQGQYDIPDLIPTATGCCMFIHKKVFTDQPLFDDRFFLYYEDTDLCLRASSLGQIWYVPQAHLWHINSGSSGSGSKLHDYFLTRNRLLIGQRYAPLRTKIALLKESLRHLINGRPYQRLAVKDFYLRRFNRGSYN